MRIAIVGPESSGKTTLAEYLEETLECHMVPEFAREYLSQRKGREYDINDVSRIAKVHFKNMHRLDTPFTVCDTEMSTIVIWSEERFEEAHEGMLKLEENQTVDHYILCKPDLPWQPDPLRENEKDRDRIFERYQTRLTALDRSFKVLEGEGDSRNEDAVEFVKNWIAEVPTE